MFSIFSQGASQKVLIVSLTVNKKTFLKLVALFTKILLIMILHYCYFENWKNRQGYNYLQIFTKKDFEEFDFSIFTFIFAIVVETMHISYFDSLKLHSEIK